MCLILNIRQARCSLLLVLCSAVLLACGGGNGSGGSTRVLNEREQALACESPYEYAPPVDPEIGIYTASVEDKPVDSALLIQMLSDMHCGGRAHGLNSVLIEVGGELVVEEYFPGFVSASNRIILDYGVDTLHVQASVQKSFVSALMGIAEQEGFIDTASETLYSLFPEYSDINWFEPYNIDGVDYQKADITVEDFLLMSSGLEWDEGSIYYGHPANTLTQMNESDDAIRFVFEQPLVNAPGEVFEYNTGLSDILKEIIQRKTGVSLSGYAQQTLFSDLSINNFYWQQHLSLRPRDMLKLGATYLNNGIFEGVQAVPEDWVEQSLARTKVLSPGERISGYGYQWWRSDFTIDGTVYEANAALGYGGQQIYIFEQFDAIVVFTAAEYSGQHGDAFTTYSWLRDYIVPALIEGAAP